MKSATKVLAIGIFVASLSLSSAFGQVEISPYGGWVNPDSTRIGEIKSQALWGVRTGFHLDPSTTIEVNFGYLNHFEVKDTDPKSRGYIWEIGPTYTFDAEDWHIPKAFTPHLSGSVGGITTQLSDNGFSYPVFDQIQVVNGETLNTVRQVDLRSGDTFLTMSGGAGFKVNPGPFGLRADIRARIMPNYYRSTPIWLEATLGLSFVIGRH